MPWPEIRELHSLAVMDDVRVFKFTLHFADGSVEVFDGENAFWGNATRASTMANLVREQRAQDGKRVVKWVIEELDDA